jgi:hydroxymethylpyrimidine kinase/phosphomethylpyrimidine kinase/thiamine-phosphate diphosphorylase
MPQCSLYPIVDSSDWVERLLTLGITTIQLRIKNCPVDVIKKEIRRSVQLAKNKGAMLFINDYWELAILYGASGIHLGQEDLKNIDMSRIHAAKLRLGISTHCYEEVARAHAYYPSYIACGPIFPTTTKYMRFMPQGLDQLKCWRSILSQYPLVAIGGINKDNILEVKATGVQGIAMISAITQAANPIQQTQELMSLIQ